MPDVIAALAQRARALAAGLVAAPLWLLAGCPVTQPQDTPVSEQRLTEARTGASYYLYVPSDYDERRAWPLVVTLHGTHGFDSAHAQVKEWKYLAEKHGFLVLAPSLSSPQGILPVARSLRLKALETDERRVLAALAEVESRYRIDTRNVLITGFSAGGYPLYFIALRHPERFSALVARACNFDADIARTLPVTEKLRAMPMYIFFSKTGINPISSSLNPIARQSWEAFRFLRLAGCHKARIKAVSGGHHRCPQRALSFWMKHMSPRP